jgi:hypothetical protein
MPEPDASVFVSIQNGGERNRDQSGSSSQRPLGQAPEWPFDISSPSRQGFRPYPAAISSSLLLIPGVPGRGSRGAEPSTFCAPFAWLERNQCFPLSGEGRKRMLPRGASSIRGVFLVLARHERRSRCCEVDRSQKTNGFDTPMYGSAFGKRA